MMAYFSPSMTMYPKNHASNLSYNGWYPGYHPSANPQFLESDMSHHASTVYYGSPHIFQTSPEWAHEFSAAQALQAPPPGNSGSHHINQHIHSDHLNEGIPSLPSPPVTVSGSEMSSPGAPNESTSPQAALRPAPAKSPYQWLTKNPQPHTGKTRTKDKYRVVYTDYQRLELEKEYHTSRYITIRRKSELAQSLQLSERQVKIWFQNRRAKERKTDKKRTDPMHPGGLSHQHNASGNALSNHLDIKPKLEPGLHLQHPLHQISAMGMSMGSLSLHHPSLHHSHHHYNLSPSPMAGAPQPTAASSQQHQQHQQQQQQQQQQQHQQAHQQQQQQLIQQAQQAGTLSI